MKYLAILLVRFYRKFLSPLKGKPVCRFTPSCSVYAIEALQKRGFFVGLFLTVWRILRCNPFCPGGYDPVPLRGIRPTIGGRKLTFRKPKTMPKTVCPDYYAHAPIRRCVRIGDDPQTTHTPTL